MKKLRSEVLVVGSGAGGALTAALLAESGFDVLIAEEGPDVDPGSIASNSTEAIARLYRDGGMTPILGAPNIAFVEGRCVGGSTEVNSGFWQRIPEDCYPRWRADALLDGFAPEILEPCFDRIERELSITTPDPNRSDLPGGSRAMLEGSARLQWSSAPVSRSAEDPTGDPFAPGAKQSMQRTYLPRARAAGARVLANCRIGRILHEGSGVIGAEGIHEGERFTVRCDFLFVCGGAVQTPCLLQRSGIKKNVGRSLCIHPMIRAAALFDRDMNATAGTLPVIQVTEFKPTITIEGSVFTPGFLAVLLAENWPDTRHLMPEWRRMAIYYAATRGLSRGSVRALPGGGALVRYRLSGADRRTLTIGLARLGELLFAAGAKAVIPAWRARSRPVLTSASECRGLLETVIPAAELSVSTMHAFSSCPMGENPDICATDSFGRVVDFANLYVNDASLIPDSPGVNPQGTTMAIAMRNAERFLENTQRRRAAKRRQHSRTPDYLVTGAPGWLGTRLVEALASDGASHVRCLVARASDPAPLAALADRVELCAGDLRDRESLQEFCEGAEGATVVHAAGIIHPVWRTREFDEINVEGTRRLLDAARAARVRRFVAVSSNSPLGASRDPTIVFDEDSPLEPFLGYGRSRAAMEGLVRGAASSFETVILRAPWLYGPQGPPGQGLFFRMIRTGRLPILGDGTQPRSMVYIDNLCDAIELAASRDEAAGRTYWIADERPYTLNEIVTTVRAALEEDFDIRCADRELRLPAWVGDAAYLVDWALQGFGVYQQKIHALGEMNRTIACSISRATDELGYRPRISLREGMSASIRWCLENGQPV